jgi:hypothetical protein
MRKIGIIAVLALMVTALAAVPALAQSGHFVGTPTCTDSGTQLSCSGKVAGLGGTTFRIEVVSVGATADVTCTNPAGNVAPGQRFSFNASGSTGNLPTPRNGSYNFSALQTAAPTAPAGSCPNTKWTATVTDVQFTSATLNLYEGTATTPSDTTTIQL